MRLSLQIQARKLSAARAAFARARALSPKRRQEIARLGWEALQLRRAARLIEQVLFAEGGLQALFDGQSVGGRKL